MHMRHFPHFPAQTQLDAAFDIVARIGYRIVRAHRGIAKQNGAGTGWTDQQLHDPGLGFNALHRRSSAHNRRPRAPQKAGFRAGHRGTAEPAYTAIRHVKCGVAGT